MASIFQHSALALTVEPFPRAMPGRQARPAGDDGPEALCSSHVPSLHVQASNSFEGRWLDLLCDLPSFRFFVRCTSRVFARLLGTNQRLAERVVTDGARMHKMNGATKEKQQGQQSHCSVASNQGIRKKCIGR